MAPTSDKSKPTKSQQRDARRSKSRNTSPISISATVETSSSSSSSASNSYFNTPIAPLHLNSVPTIDHVIERNGGGMNVPSAANLHGMQDGIKHNILTPIRQRGEFCDRALRELAAKRKDHEEQERIRDREQQEAEERRRKLKKMSSKRDSEERPLAVGAHGVARQDGVDVHKEISSSISSPVSQAPPSAGTAPAEAPSPSNSEASHQPPPAAAIPKYQTFGPDPSKFDDPTIYHIRDITPGMSEEEKKEILCVNVYPESDLHDLTPGTPPDKDFSNAKPPQQATATAFANSVEPYIRALTEEDVAFLKERGDRVTPFILPARGSRHYKEIWADEDGAMAIDQNGEKYPPYEPRGSLDQMGDDVLETNNVSAGPVLSRILALARTERRVTSSDVNGDGNGTVNGDHSMDIDGDTQNGTESSQPLPSATHMAESEVNGWKPPPAVGKPDYASLDDRLLQELRHVGLIGPEDIPNFQGHFDDEVAARLRHLQSELRNQSIINGARKARIHELTLERMAMQEYQQIADDLDNQLNQAYLKRNRNMGKGKKIQKRPGGAGGGSHPVPGSLQRPAVGEPIRLLMERKSMWNGLIGPVVNYGKTSIPKESIFTDDAMKKHFDKEQESWNETEE